MFKQMVNLEPETWDKIQHSMCPKLDLYELTLHLQKVKCSQILAIFLSCYRRSNSEQALVYGFERQ